MDKLTCEKVSSMLSLYIDNRLDEEHKYFIEEHFKMCPSCYQKYKKIKNIIENLRISSEKILKELENIKAANLFNIREYENFHNNLSAFIDNEMEDDECIEFRKYLLKSQAARSELKSGYKLKNNIQASIEKFIGNADIDFSKKIINELKKDKPKKVQKYKLPKVAIFSGILLISVSFMLAFIHPDKINPPKFFKHHKKVIYVENTTQKKQILAKKSG